MKFLFKGITMNINDTRQRHQIVAIDGDAVGRSVVNNLATCNADVALGQFAPGSSEPFRLASKLIWSRLRLQLSVAQGVRLAAYDKFANLTKFMLTMTG